MTVAETQRVLRLGRTKLYQLVTEWRETGGASGLEVIELGTALRVPRRALEVIVGGPVHVPPADDPPEPDATPTPTVATERAETVRRSRQHVPAAQLDLFDPRPGI